MDVALGTSPAVAVTTMVDGGYLVDLDTSPAIEIATEVDDG